MFKKLLPIQFRFGKYRKDLYSFKELESLVNLRPFMTQRRCIFPTNHEQHKWNNSPWTTDPGSWPISVIKKLIQQDTCYLADASRASKKINQTCHELEKIFKLPADCHIFFSLKKGAEGLRKHKDTAHNFIVMCVGEVKVNVFLEEEIELILEPGDYVFIPARVDHSITTLTDKRLSCSFPMSISLTREELKKKDFQIETREWITV